MQATLVDATCVLVMCAKRFGEHNQSGGDGNDVLSGNSGNDDANGEAGNDTNYGGSGRDFLYGDVYD